MKRLCLALTVVVALACAREPSINQPTDRAVRTTVLPRADLDCTGSLSAKCADLSELIGYLEDHTDSECRALGAESRARFDAPAGQAGFILNATPSSSYGAYTLMVEDSNKPSGWKAYDNYTTIEPVYWTGGLDYRRGTVAHEQDHADGLDGPYHNTGEAARVGDLCR